MEGRWLSMERPINVWLLWMWILQLQHSQNSLLRGFLIVFSILASLNHAWWMSHRSGFGRFLALHQWIRVNLIVARSGTIRTCVCYAQTNVKIAAGYAGVSDFKDGATHYSISDLANVRALPNMTVIVPADAAEAAAWVPLIAEYDGPVYLRLSRAGALPVYQSGAKLEIGKGRLLRSGDDLTLVATGTMVGRCFVAAEKLSAIGIDARLLEVHTLKPLDRELLISAAEETGAVVTAEEHNIIGGLGSAVAEALAETVPIPIERVGIPDRFCVTGRDLDKLMDHSGLSVENIIAAAMRVMERKR